MSDGEPQGEAGEGARSVLREALAALVAPVDGEPRAEDLADVLWISRLAGLAPVAGGDPAPTVPDEPAPAVEPAAEEPGEEPGEEPSRRSPAPGRPRPGRPERPDPAPKAEPATGPTVELHSRPAPTGAGGRGAEIVQVTRPTALPGALAIARALRPLRRPLRHRSGGLRRLHLDEEATAAATAEAGILLPVWQRTQPRYSVDLLVDTGATMAVWHDLAGELATLLERHGAFEEVRTWSLDTDRAVPHLTPFRRRRRAAAPPTATPGSGWSRPLAQPHGRRILFVLTDGVGPAWYGEHLPAFLARTAATGPTAALQVLPRRLWHRTALRPAPVEGRAATHSRPAPVFRSDAALPGIPRGTAGAAARAAVRWLPVMEIDADWLAPWADLTAGRTAGWTPMLAAPLTGVPRAQRPRRTATAPAPAADRVAAFRAGSSPDAYRLVCHLAAAPLSLPVMRLVQRATVPESGQRELAELFLSGLLEVRQEAADPEETVYDFVDGVRDELLAELTRTESVRVLDHVLAKVSGRVAATFGGTLDFRALAAGAGASGHRLPDRSRPFAEVAAAVLAGAGGQHAELARTLAGAAHRSTIRRDLLTPVPPIVSPPDPPRMIGRKLDLSLLTESCQWGIVQPGSRRAELVVIESGPGMGRRRLVQEYVRRHGQSHSLVHWIDGRTTESLVAGVDRLRAALGPAGPPDSTLGELVGAHPNWLVVVDGLRYGRWPSGVDLRELFGLVEAGPGCLIVTTASRGALELPRSGTVITLVRLTEAELREEIRARLGDDYARIEHSQEFRSLLDQTPRIPDQLAAWDLDDRLATLTASIRRRGSLLDSRSLPLPSRALAMAVVPNSAGPGPLALYGEDGQVHFVDAEDGREVSPPLVLDAGPDVVAMAALGHRSRRSVICTADSHSRLAFWDGTDGSLIGRRRTLPWQPVAMAAHTHTDGRTYVLITDAEDHVQLWDAESRDPVVYLRGFSGHQLTTVTSVPRVGGESVLLGLDRRRTVRRWEPGDLFENGPDLADHLDGHGVRAIVGVAGDEHRLVVAVLGDGGTHLQVGELAGSRRSETERELVGWHFRRVESIAQGAMGEIWRGEDVRDGSAVVIKTFDQPRHRVRDPELFLEQARRLRSLDHPGIVACRTGVADRRRLYLVLEFIDGPNLRDVLARERMSLQEAAAIAHSVAEALDYLHGHGVVHGDVKPSNILMRPDGTPALCDFGIDVDGRAGSFGTAEDIRALGGMLQEMLAVVSRIGSSMPTARKALVELALDMVHPDPRSRPSSAAEVARRIARSGVLGQDAHEPEVELRFALLGDVRAWVDGEPLELGPPERKEVLAVLLKNAGALIRLEELVREVQGPGPESVQDLDRVQGHVHELQRTLNAIPGPEDILDSWSTNRPGYILKISPEQVDATLFELALNRAETALSAGSHRDARLHLSEALDLWQGTPLADLYGPYAVRERRRLEGRYVRALALFNSTDSEPDRHGLRFSLLGPLRAWRDDEPLALGTPHQQAVLAALLLSVPSPVSTMELVNAVWGDQPPPMAVAALRTYISRLRTVLEGRKDRRGQADILRSVSDGYALAISRRAVDAALFEDRLSSAAAAEDTGDLHAAHVLLSSALGLWEGRALFGVPGPRASLESARLTERRVVALEDLFATALGLGRHEEVVEEIGRLVDGDPLRERLSALLMLALHRSGRRSEALDVYERHRTLRYQESHDEPALMLTSLHDRIRSGDPGLRASGSVKGLLAAPDRPTGSGAAAGGRLDADELSLEMLDFDANPLFVVFGGSGSGKTSLLRRLVEQLTERFTPDEVGILIGEVGHSLANSVTDGHLVHHAPGSVEMPALASILRVACAGRADLPPERRGKDIYLVLDDFELIAGDGEDGGLSSLTEYLPQARELGLKVIVACRSEEAMRGTLSDPFLNTLWRPGVRGVLLSGELPEDLALGAARPQPLLPGEALYVVPDPPSGVLILTGRLPFTGESAFNA